MQNYEKYSKLEHDLANILQEDKEFSKLYFAKLDGVDQIRYSNGYLSNPSYGEATSVTIADTFRNQLAPLIGEICNQCKLSPATKLPEPDTPDGKNFLIGMVKMVKLYLASMLTLNSIGKHLYEGMYGKLVISGATPTDISSLSNYGRKLNFEFCLADIDLNDALMDYETGYGNYKFELTLLFNFMTLTKDNPVEFITDVGRYNRSVGDLLKTEEYWQVMVGYHFTDRDLVQKCNKRINASLAPDWYGCSTFISSGNLLSKTRYYAGQHWRAIYNLATRLKQ